MFGLDDIGKTIELCLWSAYIKGEQPVSCIITAPPEAGKTVVLMKYSDNEGCIVLTDATAFGIMRDYGEKIKERKVRDIIIPDLIKPMSRGKDTVNTFVAFLNSIIEEGFLSSSTYAETIGLQDSNNKPIPIKCGLITTMARDILADGRHHWAHMGFISRLLLVSYEYNATTQFKIHESIAERKYHDETKVTLKLPSEDVTIALEKDEADVLAKLAAMSADFGIKDSKGKPIKAYGFRLQKNLQRLAMASALSEGRYVVDGHDIEVIVELAKYINLNYTQL